MEELFDRSGGRAVRRSGVYPPVNLYETVDAYILTAELPGLRPGDIEISIENNRLTLRGERRIEHTGDAGIHRSERQSGRFRRAFELPVEVDPDKAEASQRHGVLMVRVPKAERHRPRRISVKSEEGR